MKAVVFLVLVSFAISAVFSSPTSGRRVKRDWTLPGYLYLGPGNKVDNGEPKNDVDRVAFEHDRKYEYIVEQYKRHKDKELFMYEVKEADKEFTRSLKRLNLENSHFWEKVGKKLGTFLIERKMQIDQWFKKVAGWVTYPWLN